MTGLVAPTSGNPWVDWVITVGAVVTALVAVWRKVVKPIVHAALRVNGVFDLADELPPSVTTVLLALPAQVQEIHDRINDHMNKEEDSFDSISSDLVNLRATLDERSERFDAMNTTLTDHIAHDDERFQAATAQLSEGQDKMMARLNEIPPLPTRKKV